MNDLIDLIRHRMESYSNWSRFQCDRSGLSPEQVAKRLEARIPDPEALTRSRLLLEVDDIIFRG